MIIRGGCVCLATQGVCGVLLTSTLGVGCSIVKIYSWGEDVIGVLSISTLGIEMSIATDYRKIGFSLRAVVGI